MSNAAALTSLESAELSAARQTARAEDAVECRVRIELGRTRLSPDEAAQLGAGSVVALDEAADEPARILADGRLIARGQVFIRDGRYCVRVIERVVDVQTTIG